MRFHHWWLECKNLECKASIPLPHLNQSGRPPNLAEWPTGEWQQTFLCLRCGHVHEYSELSPQTVLAATRNPYEATICSTWIIRLDCAQENCGTQVTTHTIGDVSITRQAIVDTVPRWRFHFDCAGGDHHPKVPQQDMIEVRVCLFSWPNGC
jgi:hypothetical protein